jgi:hypothetical protein
VVSVLVMRIKISILHAVAVATELADFKQGFLKDRVVVFAVGVAIHFSGCIAFSGVVFSVCHFWGSIGGVLICGVVRGLYDHFWESVCGFPYILNFFF